MAVDADAGLCRILCGLCCVDHGHACPRLGPAGCTLPREQRPSGCREYLCGVAKAVADGRIDVEYGRELKAWDGEQEKLKTEVT